ncbi:MAG: hypothetical protein LBS60_11675 [Deltaproteobacteria bacterium]|nr:hypothetical protein [Deltaproteobacteria bacterium]
MRTTIAQLKWSYIAIRDFDEEINKFLGDFGPYKEVRAPRPYECFPTSIKVKEVVVRGARYITYQNWDAAREDSLANEEDIYLEDSPGAGAIFLETNLDSSAAEIALRVERLLFPTIRFLRDRSNCFQADELLYGYLGRDFLALLSRSFLMETLASEAKESDPPLEWADALAELENLTILQLLIKDKRVEILSNAQPLALKAFKALGLQSPDRLTIRKTPKEMI